MAVVSNIHAVRAVMKLDNGTTATGNIKTVSVPFPEINASAWDMNKAWAIANALDNGCLSKALCWVSKTEEDYITAE